jgi:hypothetical protein
MSESPGRRIHRFLVPLACLLLLPLSAVFADSPGTAPPAAPSLSVDPASAAATVERDLVGHGFPASTKVPIVVFAPDGSQTALAGESDASGSLSVLLTPPGGFTQDGLYRAVLREGSGQAQSALFAVGDGKPDLSAQPAVFSPYSALQILGSGLPPTQGIDLMLTLANDRGDRTLETSTDAAGFLQMFIWPEELGESFFEAGVYRAALPALGLSVIFQVREQPTGAVVAVSGPALSGSPAPIRFRRYAPHRYLWTVYADASGYVRGEMLFGPTDVSGSLDVQGLFVGLDGGQYRLATPYDWGETTFAAIPATPTPTETSTPTDTATATPTDFPTNTPTPAPVKYKKVCKRKHGKKKCKRVRVSPEPRMESGEK